MRHRVLGSAIVVAAAAILVAAAGVVHAQSGDDKTWEPPRTADGQPDIQGVWTNFDPTPFEAPDDVDLERLAPLAAWFPRQQPAAAGAGDAGSRGAHPCAAGAVGRRAGQRAPQRAPEVDGGRPADPAAFRSETTLATRATTT